MRILTRVLLTVVLWFPGTVAAETVPSRGAALAQTCVTCHGPPVARHTLVRRHHHRFAGVPCRDTAEHGDAPHCQGARRY